MPLILRELKSCCSGRSVGYGCIRVRTKFGEQRSTVTYGKAQAILNGRALGEANKPDLRSREVMPHFASGLHLEDSALIRMEEVVSIRNSVVGSRFHRATRPVGRTDSAAMLLDLGHEVDSIFHPILDAGRPGGY